MERVSKTQERSDGIIKPGPLALPDTPKTTARPGSTTIRQTLPAKGRRIIIIKPFEVNKLTLTVTIIHSV